jgi:transposase
MNAQLKWALGKRQSRLLCIHTRNTITIRCRRRRKGRGSARWCRLVSGLIKRGRPRRSKLVIMDRDFEAKKHSYSAASYIKTLEEGLLPYYKLGDIFQQDNAPIHTAHALREWLESHGIWTMDWPPYSPDLNPIKHMWWALKKIVHKLHPELINIGRSEADLKLLCKALKEAWRKIPNSLIKKLILSMPRRLAVVRKARGYQTKY